MNRVQYISDLVEQFSTVITPNDMEKIIREVETEYPVDKNKPYDERLVDYGKQMLEMEYRFHVYANKNSK